MNSKISEQLEPLKQTNSPLASLVNAGKKILAKRIESAQKNAESETTKALEENKILQRFASITKTVESGLNDFKNFKESCLSSVVSPESHADAVLQRILNRGAQFVNNDDLSSLSSRLEHGKAAKLLIEAFERNVLANNDRGLKEFIAKHGEVLKKHSLI